MNDIISVSLSESALGQIILHLGEKKHAFDLMCFRTSSTKQKMCLKQLKQILTNFGRWEK